MSSKSSINSKLIIYYKNDEILEWGVLHSTGNFEKSPESSLKEISEREFSEIIAIAPAAAVLLTEATLPKMNKSRILQALPFALEELLLTDITDLHFAIAPLEKFSKDTVEITIPTAVVSKAKITEWLSKLNSENIYPTSLLPAPLLVEKEENCWSVFIEGDFAITRMATYQGSTCDTDNLQAYLSFQLHEAAEKPTAIYIYNFSDRKINLSLDDTSVIEKSVTNKSMLDFFAANIPKNYINLLQGMPQLKRKTGDNKNLWRVIPALAIAWLVLIIFSNSISIFELHSKDETLQANIKKIYKENFPNATSVVAAKQRMSDKLKSLANNGQKNHFLASLTELGKTLQEKPGFKIKEMDYRNNLIEVQFSAANFSEVDKIINMLSEKGISAKQENVSQTGTEVKGILIISEGMPS